MVKPFLLEADLRVCIVPSGEGRYRHEDLGLTFWPAALRLLPESLTEALVAHVLTHAWLCTIGGRDVDEEDAANGVARQWRSRKYPRCRPRHATVHSRRRGSRAALRPRVAPATITGIASRPWTC
jgi:hypothetical protein